MSHKVLFKKIINCHINSNFVFDNLFNHIPITPRQVRTKFRGVHCSIVLMTVLKDKGYKFVDKAEVTVAKPKIKSKRASGQKPVSTSHNREIGSEAVEETAEVSSAVAISN